MPEVMTIETPSLGDRSYLIRDGADAVTVMHTPGHTPGHLSYVLGETGQSPFAVFTGGSLLYGAVGRTDLLGPQLTEPLTRAQYRSVRRLAAELPGEVAVYPTHGFGSFCSATPTTGTSSTIGHERLANVALRSDEDHFVRDLLAGLGAYPRYYAHMGPANRRGPLAAEPAPPAPADPVADFGGLAAAWGQPGQVVLDVRRPEEWRDGHLSGAVHIPFWELESRVSEVPEGEVWVYCHSGLRASIAASLLARAGRQVVHVDDDFEKAAAAGLPVRRP